MDFNVHLEKRNFPYRSLVAIVLLFAQLISISDTQARIVFDSEFIQSDGGDTLLIDSNDDATGAPKIQFGNTLNKVLQYNTTDSIFELTDGSSGREKLSFELETLAALPGGGPGLAASDSGRIIQLTSTDSIAPGCTITPFCGAGTYVWNGSTWISLTGSTSSNFNKLITVGSSGADYTTIAAGAIYLNSLSGGIMLLSAETHAVTTAVDLENIILIGKDPTRTTIAISGAGQLDTFDTVFEQLTLDVNAITDDMALDVQTGSNSLRFNFVDVDVQDSSDSLIDSNAGAAPTVSMKFVKTNAVGAGSGTVLKSVASGNINAASEIFVDSRSSDSPLQMNDWDIILVGGGSVYTTGTITSVPAQSIIVSPQMNLQGAIDSLEVTGNGGLITLLPGTHTITTTLTINDDNIQMVGYGDSSVISASGITGGSTVGAIQVGAADGTAPVNGVILKDFKLEVTGTGATDIHGIRITGGENNTVDNVTVQKVSGTSGTGATARVGIQFIDGAAGCTGTCVLTRPVITKSRVFGNGGTNYFTDGIHLSSDPTVSGVFGNNQGVVNALLDGNVVDYVRETAYVYVGVSNSSLFNNRASRMGAGGGGAYGIYMGNIDNINMSANVFSGSLSTASIAIGIEALNTGAAKTTQDSLFTNNVVDGLGNGGVGFGTGFQIGNATNTTVIRSSFSHNSITGASNAVTVAIVVRGNADDNMFNDNDISGGTDSWDTGINLQAAAQERNLISNNVFSNTTTLITDVGTSTRIDVTHVRSTTDPTVNEDRNDGFKVGTIWINTSTGGTYILSDETPGAAVWQSFATSSNQTKYLFMDINGGVNNSVTVGTVATGFSAVLQYDAGGTSNTGWSFPVPDDWVSGTNIVVEVFWTPSNTNTGNVEWDFDYATFATGATLAGGSFTNIGFTQAAPGTTLQLTSTGSTFSIPSGSIAAGRMVNFRINRDGGAGTDTFTGTLNVHMVRVNYTAKKLN